MSLFLVYGEIGVKGDAVDTYRTTVHAVGQFKNWLNIGHGKDNNNRLANWQHNCSKGYSAFILSITVLKKKKTCN